MKNLSGAVDFDYLRALVDFDSGEVGEVQLDDRSEAEHKQRLVAAAAVLSLSLEWSPVPHPRVLHFRVHRINKLYGHFA